MSNCDGLLGPRVSELFDRDATDHGFIATRLLFRRAPGSDLTHEQRLFARAAANAPAGLREAAAALAGDGDDDLPF